MPFEATLVKTPDKNEFLSLNCIHVKGEYWIYEGLNELLDDELTVYSAIDGIVPSLGDYSQDELIEGCINWFGTDINSPHKHK